MVKDFSLGVSHVTLSRVKKQFELWGSLSKAERRGQKPLYDAATIARLEQWITKNSVYRRMSYQAIKYLGKFPGSVRRIRQACSALGFQKCIPRQKQLITERQRQILYLWGLDHLKYKREDWERVIWTDESSFSTAHSAYNVRVLRCPREEYHPDCVQKERWSGRESVMVWGRFCGTTKSQLHVVKGKASKICILN